MAKSDKNIPSIIGDFDGGSITLRFGQTPHGKKISSVQDKKNLLHIRVFFDDQIAHEFFMPRDTPQVVLPLLSSTIPESLEVFDVAADISIYNKSLSLENIFQFMISSMAGRGLRFSIELISNLNFKVLSVDLRLDDGAILAAGKLAQTKADNGRFFYRGSLDLACFLKVGPPQIARLFVFQKPTECAVYVGASDVGVVGYVDISRSSVVAGWIGSFNDVSPLSVTLWIDGSPVATTIADNPRPDVSAIGIISPNCGFTFSEKQIGTIPVGSSISVSTSESSTLHLLNCPLEVIS
jgi:hypothetical protein